MIKSYTVTTTEIDDADVAVKQITEKVASFNLLANTVGIINAHPEFAASDMLTAISKALPFPTFGITTISHCADGEIGTYMLSLLILTSDDCQFSYGLSGPINPEDDVSKVTDTVRRCYDDTRGHIPGDPKFAILYMPFFNVPRQSDFISAMADIDKYMPIFGAVASDNPVNSTPTNNGSRTFYQGACYTNRLVMALICGNVEPKFYLATLTDDAVIMPRVGVITAANNNKLLGVNNVNATDFFKNIGFLPSGNMEYNRGLLSSIFVMHIKDESDGGINISRVPIAVDSEGIYCGGRLIVGASISIAFNTKDIVLETAEKFLYDIKNCHRGGTAVIQSCIGRRYGLLSDPTKELELIRDSLGTDFHYVAAYSNGEMCPMMGAGDCANNTEHNQALVACVF